MATSTKKLSSVQHHRLAVLFFQQFVVENQFFRTKDIIVTQLVLTKQYMRYISCKTTIMAQIVNNICWILINVVSRYLSIYIVIYIIFMFYLSLLFQDIYFHVPISFVYMPHH